MRNFLVPDHTKRLEVFLIALTISLVATGTNTIHAQELFSADPDDASTESDATLFKNNVSLWIPSKMIKGQTYEGLVVISDAATAGQLVLITSSDKTVIEPQKSITVLPGLNHGIFEIKAQKEGNARIFASVNGEVTSAEARVYSSSSSPDKLSMFLPSNSTKTGKVPVYVFTLDRNGSPASVKDNIAVHLSSSSDMIKVPESVTIHNQTYYAKFTAEVNGGGKITASAQNLKPDTVSMKRQQENIDVLMAIAPNIALENSQIYYYVWLEKDGKPFKPSRVIDVLLSSNDPQVARFSPRGTSPHYGDGTIYAKITDGIARGTLFTGERGSTTISANVDGFGHAQTDIIVGPVRLENNGGPSGSVQGELSSDIQDANVTISSRLDAIYHPNKVLTWVFPAKTSDKAYGVAALYWQNVTKSVNAGISQINGTSVQSTLSTQTLVPLPLDDRTVNIASQVGLAHKTMYQMSQSTRLESTEGKGRLSAIEFELAASNQGDYTISVSGPGLDTDKTKLQVVPEYAESYKIGIVPLPSRPDVLQDLAMVSILDKEGNLVDSGIAQKDIKIVTSKIQGTGKGFASAQNVIVAGKVTEQASIVASVDNIGTAATDIIPAGISTAIEFELPKTIHVGEPAPYAIHEVDIFGTPLAKIQPIGMSTSGGIAIDRNQQHLVARNQGQGKVAILADAGADTKNFDAFSNSMNVEVVLDKGRVRVGEKASLAVISDVPNLEITIDSPVAFSKTEQDDKITYFWAYPDREGTFDVTVTAQKDGYTPVTKSLRFDAVRLFDLTVNAVSTQDGRDLSAKYALVTSNQTINGITPYNKELGPSEITLSFPSEQKTDDRNYSLKKIRIGNEDYAGQEREFFLNNNTVVTAYYDRMIKIDVAGAKGAGFYPYGQTVTLSVPPKDKISFFVREVFDRWDGLPYETEEVSFTASEDVSGSVVYRDDYSFLMLVVAAIVTAVLYTTAIKNKVNLRWEISKLFDLLRNNIKISPPKISKVRDSLEGKKKKFSWQLKRKGQT